MTRRLSAWIGTLLGPLLLVPLAAAAGAGDGGSEAVDSLLRGLASDRCETRLESRFNYFKSVEKEAAQTAALKRRVKTLDAPLRARVGMILELMEERARGRARTQALMKQAGQVQGAGDKAKQAAALDRLRQRLLRVIHDPKEAFNARLNAPWLLVRVSGFGLEFDPDWGKELPRLLESPDLGVRLVGALTAADGRFPKGSDPPKSVVIRVLIDGLQSDSVAARDFARRGLLDVLRMIPEGLCFDPTDPLEGRAEAIRRWEAWWTANQEQLSRETIPQIFW